MSDTVEFPGARGKRETDRALLCEIDGRDFWIPKSQIHDDSEVYRGDTDGTLVVSRWWYEQHEAELCTVMTTEEDFSSPIPMTHEQRKVFDRAVGYLRRRLVNPELSEGRVVELLAADYLSGVVE
jgi:hypothetical protein